MLGCTTTKQVGKIVLVFVNGNILKIILIVMIFVLMIIEIRIKCLTVVKKRVVIYTIDFFFLIQHLFMTLALIFEHFHGD